MKRKVISPKSLPTRLPVTFTMVLGLLLDRYDAPGWVWGATGAIMLLIWVAAAIGKVYEDSVEVLK